MAEDGGLKAHIDRQLMVLEGQPSPDIAQTTREWLAQKGVLDLIVDAISGKEIEDANGNKEVLKLKDRINFAMKLSNKILPDLKSTESKKTEQINVNVKHQATQDLLNDAGIYGGAPIEGEVIEQDE